MTSDSQTEVTADQFVCHICQTAVPEGSKASHEGSLQHQAGSKIAAAALDRLRAYLVQTIDEDLTREQTEPGSETEPLVSFCVSCATTVEAAELQRHERTKTHLMAALDDQVFDELVRGYLDEGDLAKLGAPSSDPTYNVDSKTYSRSDAERTYKCHLCDLDIPYVFAVDHGHSSRHKACEALASSAAGRISADIRKKPINENSKTTPKNVLIQLLKAYTGEDLKVEVTEEVVEEKEEVAVGKRLTAKRYFKDILPFLKYVGAFYTIIVDDTDFVTVKVGATYLRVHVTNFNGLYSIGDSKDYKLRCRMCDGYHGVSYSSAGQQDKLHVMSLGHIKRLLSPIDNVHGIRKIDDCNSICILCNSVMATFAVEDHIMKDIQHTYFLTEALEQGRKFKESADDLKIVLYSSTLEKSGFFMKHPPNNFNSVLPHHGALFGGVSYPQGGTGFGNNNSFPQSGGTLFGSTNAVAQDTTKRGGALFGGPAQAQSFGSGNTASLSSMSSKPSGSSNVTFGSAQPASVGSSGTFGSGPPAAVNIGFGSVQPTANNVGFGSVQSADSKSMSFGATQAFGGTNAFGNSQTVPNSVTFGSKRSFGSDNVSEDSGSSGGVFGRTQPIGSSGLFGSSNSAVPVSEAVNLSATVTSPQS